MAEGRELELKYAVADRAAVEEIVSADVVFGLEAGPWREYDVVDQYLDTRSGSLARAGYGARLRRVGRRTIVTVKSAARRAAGNRSGRAALHDRMELEAPATRRLDPARWPQSPARAVIVASAGGEALHTLFTIEQHRRERELLRDGGVVAKLSLDSGVVKRFARPLGDIDALEIEATAAHPAEARRVLARIASDIEKVDALRPEERSKEELAQAMIERALTEAKPVKPPAKPGIGADDSLAEAGRKVLRMHLLRMLAAEPGARLGEGAQGVHKMRVATRRMRAAWRVFDGAYPAKVQKRYVAELREVAQALGAVRDLDVQLERLAAYRANLTSDEARGALEPLVADWRGNRGAARKDLLDLLQGAAYDRFISDYRAFAETAVGAPADAGAVDEPAGRLRHSAAGRIWLAYERLRAHDAAVPFADVPALHALRIDGKRFRYTLEFVREILPTAVDPLIAEVTKLQDHVGQLNDSQIAAETTRAWLIDAAASLTAAEKRAAAAYLRAAERDVARLTRTFPTLWRRITAPTFRRRLALVVGAI
ncbi:MAG TPA: CHAD domain-containing protein [Candidatus Limnocylindria bacterium]|nr:CHAD domain-containing protein [Candidatus Limnocylindria bacterium]